MDRFSTNDFSTKKHVVRGGLEGCKENIGKSDALMMAFEVLKS